MLQTRFWKNFDWAVFGVALVLLALGLMAIFATSFDADGLNNPADAIKQSVFAVLGLVLFFVIARSDYRSWGRLIPYLYAGGIGLLLLVELIGTSVLGAKRWINLGFFQFQPSEVMKLVLILALAKLLSEKYDLLEHPRYFLLSLGYLLLPALLVFIEPDLGSSLVLGAIWLGMALVSRLRKLYFGVLAAAGLAFLPIGISMLKPFQKARLETFFNPGADPLSTGYNVVQSQITIGSGQFFGRGLAAGSQTQLGFLPTLAQHTDFVYATIAEKLGFVGSGLVLILFAVLLVRGLVIAARASDRFGFFIAVGVVSMLFFQFTINVGMNMGVAPVTGIPLPFISYGGTSLLVAFAAAGMLESVAVRSKKLQFEG